MLKTQAGDAVCFVFVFSIIFSRHANSGQLRAMGRWRALRLAIAAACLAVAVVFVVVREDGESDGGEAAELSARSDLAADTAANIFSSHYIPPAQREFLAEHPPPPRTRKAAAAAETPPPPPPPAAAAETPAETPADDVGFDTREATAFLEDIPGMSADELKELVGAADTRHTGPVVADVTRAEQAAVTSVAEPQRLSRQTIEQERVRAADVFSRHYGKAVPTKGKAIPSVRPDDELDSVDGKAASVMRDAGEAFAQAEARKPSAHPDKLAQAAATVMIPALGTSQLTNRPSRKSVLSEVPAVDRDLLSSLDHEEDQIDDMHIMSHAQRELVRPERAEDIDSDVLKRSVNTLADQKQVRSEGSAASTSRHQRHGLNGDEGRADKRHQMQALRRAAHGHSKATPSSSSLAKALNPGANDAFSREMRSAVRASDTSNAPSIPIGDANMGDDSGASLLKDEAMSVETAEKNDKELVQDASPLWPSERISQREEQREHREARQLQEGERKIAEHEQKLQADARAAAAAEARAQTERQEAAQARAAAEKEREKAMQEQEARAQATTVAQQGAQMRSLEEPPKKPDFLKGEERMLRSQHDVVLPRKKAPAGAKVHGKQDEWRQAEAVAMQAKQHERRANVAPQPTKAKHDQDEWEHAEAVARHKKEAVMRAKETAQRIRAAAEQEERREWREAKAEAERKEMTREREERRQREQEQERAAERHEREMRQEREEEIKQEAAARKQQQLRVHSQVQPDDGSPVAQTKTAAQHGESGATTTAGIEKQIKELKKQLEQGAEKKDAERKAMEKKEQAEQARDTGSLHDIQMLGKHIREDLDLHSAPASPPPAPPRQAPAASAAAQAVGGQMSWGNLIDFMEGTSTPKKQVKPEYKQVKHAQSLALSTNDKEAEHKAMQAEGDLSAQVHQMDPREAAAKVLGGLSAEAGETDDSDEEAELKRLEASQRSKLSNTGDNAFDDDLDDDEDRPKREKKSVISNKNFDAFMAHYKQTKLKEKKFAEQMKQHMQGLFVSGLSLHVLLPTLPPSHAL